MAERKRQVRLWKNWKRLCRNSLRQVGDLIAVPAQEWLDGKADKDTLVSAIKQADKECGSCGCELDPLYKKLWSFFNTIGGINMLSLEKKKNGLKPLVMNMLTIFYADILNLKVKWALPTGIVNVMAFEQATSYFVRI